MIKMDTWMTQFGVRTEKLRLRKDHRHGPDRPVGLTYAGRPDLCWPAWHLPKTLATHHHSLGDLPMDPQTLGRQARSESKTERPHMPLQWASEVVVRCWADYPKVASAPTCKETQEELMPTIGWKLKQVEGWMSLSHGSKGPPSA